jgi:hypothetical protein
VAWAVAIAVHQQGKLAPVDLPRQLIVERLEFACKHLIVAGAVLLRFGAGNLLITLVKHIHATLLQLGNALLHPVANNSHLLNGVIKLANPDNKAPDQLLHLIRGFAQFAHGSLGRGHLLPHLMRQITDTRNIAVHVEIGTGNRFHLAGDFAQIAGGRFEITDHLGKILRRFVDHIACA